MENAGGGPTSLLTRARGELLPYRRPVAWAALPALAWAVWVSGPGWATPAVAVAAVAGAALVVIDTRTHRLPDAVVYPATVAVAALLLAAALAGGMLGTAGRALAGAVVLVVAYAVLHLVNPAGLGLGDVKLAALLGALSAWYGWGTLAATALLPFVLGGLVAAALLVTRRATRHTAIAFGPFMLAGAALALTWARLTAV
jgi:leader peptidase (prepilin peptidase)/N-methyltransferase